MTNEKFWLIIGFSGQLIFGMRFIVQWIQTERMKKSVIPVAFWYFSIIGGLTLFTYAVHRQDPVFMLGQSVGVIIYSRNLYFVRRERSAP